MFKLVICDDEGKTTVVPLIRDEFSIGRKEGNTIRLTDRNVSRQHARLFRQDNEEFFMLDLGSMNGTKVEGKKVTSKPVPVSPGEQIYIGDYKLSIRSDVIAGVPLGRQMDPGDSAGIGKVTSHARLVMLQGPNPGQETDLLANLYVIGRSDEANFFIDDASISRAHARLDGDEHQWTISDLDSINGIRVNGAKKDDYLLKSGDIIELGMVRLRFVAPGEPYEYAAGGSDVGESADPKKASKTMMVLGVIGVLAAMLIVLIVLSVGTSEDSVPSDSKPDTVTKNFDELLAAGQEKMQSQEWEEAARFFAEAQRLNSDSIKTRDLKRKATKEMEAQQALSAALQAQKKEEWQIAVDELVKIPKDSYYYDLSLQKKIAAKLCDELLYKAEFMVTAGDPKASQVLHQISKIPEISDSCREKRNGLLDLISQ